MVDDDVNLTRSLDRLLSRTCAVTVVHDGQQALDALTAPDASFDVILCDVSMPIMDVIEFYQRLSQRDPQLATQVVFVSGGATSPEAERVLTTLPNVRLQKPFHFAEVSALIEERVARNRAR